MKTRRAHANNSQTSKHPTRAATCEEGNETEGGSNTVKHRNAKKREGGVSRSSRGLASGTSPAFAQDHSLAKNELKGTDSSVLRDQSVFVASAADVEGSGVSIAQSWQKAANQAFRDPTSCPEGSTPTPIETTTGQEVCVNTANPDNHTMHLLSGKRSRDLLSSSTATRRKRLRGGTVVDTHKEPVKGEKGLRSRPHLRENLCSDKREDVICSDSESEEEGTQNVLNVLFSGSEELSKREGETRNLFPPIRIWDEVKDEEVEAIDDYREAINVLRSNRNFAFYIGQDILSHPKHIFRQLLAENDRDAWRSELTKPGYERRVMIFGPRKSQILPAQKCPLVSELPAFVAELHESELIQRSRRLRLFAAHFTSDLGLKPSKFESTFCPKQTSSDPPSSNGSERESEHNELAVGEEPSKTISAARYSLRNKRKRSFVELSDIGTAEDADNERSVTDSEGSFVEVADGQSRVRTDFKAGDIKSDFHLVDNSELSVHHSMSQSHVELNQGDKKAAIYREIFGLNSKGEHESDKDELNQDVLKWECNNLHGYGNHMSISEGGGEHGKAVMKMKMKAEMQSSDACFDESRHTQFKVYETTESECSLFGGVGDNTGRGESRSHSFNEYRQQYSSAASRMNESRVPKEEKLDRASDGHYTVQGIDCHRSKEASEDPNSFSPNEQDISPTVGRTSLPQKGQRMSNFQVVVPPAEANVPVAEFISSRGEPIGEVSPDDRNHETGPGRLRIEAPPQEHRADHSSVLSAEPLRSSAGYQPICGFEPDGTDLKNSTLPSAELIPCGIPAIQVNQVGKGIAKAGDIEGEKVLRDRTGSPIEVYIWDLDEEKRSEKPLPVVEAVELCMETDCKAIYDGQDFDFSQEQVKYLTGVTKKDRHLWLQRRKVPRKRRKIIVWNYNEGCMRTHHRSPALGRLLAWFERNPDLVVFQPLMVTAVLPNSQSGQSFRRDKEGSYLPRFSALFRKCILDRIRFMRVTALRKGRIEQILLWNPLRRCLEAPMSFSSRTLLTRFLLANPWLELHRGQDELHQIEKESEFKLVPIVPRCPADLATFWDSEKGQILTKHSIEGCNTVDATISKCSRVELYLGQDSPHWNTVRKVILEYHKSGVSSLHYMLAKCGSLVQKHLYSKGWIATFIDTRIHSAAAAVFWSESRKCVIMHPNQGNPPSIADFLLENPGIETYVGQDKNDELREELDAWFKLLRWRPKWSAEFHKPMLVKALNAPLKYRPLSALEVEHLSFDEKRARSRMRRLAAEAIRSANVDFKKGRADMETEEDVISEGRASSDSEQGPFEAKSHAKSIATVPSQDTTACSDRGSDRVDEELGRSTTPGAGIGPLLDPDVLSDDDTVDAGDIVLQQELPNTSGVVGLNLRNAAKSARRMSIIVREAGPRILKRELKHDLRQEIREELIVEVESVEHLHKLVRDVSSFEFVVRAGELCQKLQALDVNGSLSSNEAIGYGPSDLSTMLGDLELGRLYTIGHVSETFRTICADLIYFHEGTLLEYEARLLRAHGERAISQFKSEYVALVAKEEEFMRVARICERGKRIGFVPNPTRKKARSSTSVRPAGHSRTSLRLSTGHPEVTFLNYRDEKGHSVMGKRHSVRVFGPMIDRLSCEKKVGNVRPCHVCRGDVQKSKGDCLSCANRIFGSCEEVVCRDCLTQVISMEKSELGSWRQTENWICPHCRGICSAGSDCILRETVPAKKSERKFKVRFLWSCAMEDTQRVEITLTKRLLNGEYSDAASNETISLEEREYEGRRNAWSADLELSAGAYRCRIITDGVHSASTTFQVIPSQLESEEVAGSDGSRNRGQRVIYAAAPSSVGKIKWQGPRIRWEVSDQYMRGPSHAIRDPNSGDGGTVIQSCSRTEGWDWRRAKKHGICQWVPEPKEADFGTRNVLGDATTLMLSASDRRVTVQCRSEVPVPREGIPHVDFCTEWNTFKYDEMIKKTLWGIVTGKSGIHGIGLFTLTGYQKGDFVIEYAGDLVRNSVADLREMRYEAAGLGTYLFRLNDDQIVDATVQSNRARFTNHSCDPNMSAEIIHIRGRDLVVLRATREIPIFSELTFDYKLPIEDKKVECLCGSWNCVGVMN